MTSEGSDVGLFDDVDRFQRFDTAIDDVRGDLRRWHLVRVIDESGVSGTGVVASGVEFQDGTVAYRWRSSPHGANPTWQIADCIEDVERIHGHEGKSHVVWEDA